MQHHSDKDVSEDIPLVHKIFARKASVLVFRINSMCLNDPNKMVKTCTSHFRTIKNFVTVMVTGDSGGIVL